MVNADLRITHCAAKPNQDAANLTEVVIDKLRSQYPGRPPSLDTVGCIRPWQFLPADFQQTGIGLTTTAVNYPVCRNLSGQSVPSGQGAN
jgi:hypothetical protein